MTLCVCSLSSWCFYCRSKRQYFAHLLLIITMYVYTDNIIQKHTHIHTHIYIHTYIETFKGKGNHSEVPDKFYSNFFKCVD